ASISRSLPNSSHAESTAQLRASRGTPPPALTGGRTNRRRARGEGADTPSPVALLLLDQSARLAPACGRFSRLCFRVDASASPDPARAPALDDQRAHPPKLVALLLCASQPRLVTG